MNGVASDPRVDGDLYPSVIPNGIIADIAFLLGPRRASLSRGSERLYRLDPHPRFIICSDRWRGKRVGSTYAPFPFFCDAAGEIARLKENDLNFSQEAVAAALS